MFWGEIKMSINATTLVLWVAAGAALVFGWDFLDKNFFLPWRAKRMVERVMRDIKAGKKVEGPPPKFAIEFNSVGFFVRSLKDSANSGSFNWVEIQKVMVFKRDLFSYDMVCMILSKVDGTGCELDEEMRGWSEFTEAMPFHLPDCQPWEKWFMEVTTPAFETKLTEIFNREPVTHSVIEAAPKIAT